MYWKNTLKIPFQPIYGSRFLSNKINLILYQMQFLNYCRADTLLTRQSHQCINLLSVVKEKELTLVLDKPDGKFLGFDGMVRSIFHNFWAAIRPCFIMSLCKYTISPINRDGVDCLSPPLFIWKNVSRSTKRVEMLFWLVQFRRMI